MVPRVVRRVSWNSVINIDVGHHTRPAVLHRDVIGGHIARAELAIAVIIRLEHETLAALHQPQRRDRGAHIQAGPVIGDHARIRTPGGRQVAAGSATIAHAGGRAGPDAGAALVVVGSLTDLLVGSKRRTDLRAVI